MSITGAHVGDKLKAFKGKFKGMIIQVLAIPNNSPQLFPILVHLKEIEAANLFPQLAQKMRLLSQFSGQSDAQIKSWLNENCKGSDTSATEEFRDMTGISIQILSAGDSTDYARLPEELRNQAQCPEGICSTLIADSLMQINHLKKRPLVFFNDYWSFAPSLPQERTIPKNHIVLDLILGKAGMAASQLVLQKDQIALPLTISGTKVFALVPTPPTTPISLEESAIQAAYKSLPKNKASLEEFTQQYQEFSSEWLAALSSSGLKSLMQKLIRFNPIRVSLCSSPEEIETSPTLSTSRVLAFTMIALYKDSGSLNPDTQTFVRGSEAMLKRLLVIAVEDVFVSSNHESLLVSLAIASVLIKMFGTEWQLPQLILEQVFAFAFRLLRIVNFTTYDPSQKAESANKPFLFSKPDSLIGDSRSAKMALVSALLDEIKSLPGDLLMFRNVAWRVANNLATKTDLGLGERLSRPTLMPIWHCVDQHCFPDILYAFPPQMVEPFKNSRVNHYGALFSKLFTKVSGINFRKIDLSTHEKDEFWHSVQRAQALTFSAHRKSKPALPLDGTLSQQHERTFILPDASLSGMLGHIHFQNKTLDSRRFIATLHPENIFDISILVDPTTTVIGRTQLAVLSRELKENATSSEIIQDESAIAGAVDSINSRYHIEPELYKKIQDKVKESLSEPHRLVQSSSPSFVDASVSFRGAEYQIHFSNGSIQTWSKAKQCTEHYALSSQPISEVNLEGFISRVYICQSPDAEERFQQLLTDTDRLLLMHSLLYIGLSFAQNSTISMPKISRDGGGSESPLYPLDLPTFHFLVNLSSLYPNALQRRQESLASFVVNSPLLLSSLAERIRAHLSISTRSLLSGQGQWIQSIQRNFGKEAKWNLFPYPTLYPHQRHALDRMLARSAMRGNCLWIPTGQGKTAIVLEYLRQRIEAGTLCNTILYVLPRSAIQTIAAEIKRFGFDISILWPLSSAPDPDRHSISEGKKQIQLPHSRKLKEFTINLIEQDHVRLMNNYLAPKASELYVIYDEFHRAMNIETLRTANATQLISLSQDFCLLSATPVTTGDMSLLIKYVGQMVPFAVSKSNVFAAANSMIRQTATSSIPTRLLLEDAPLAADDLVLYQKLVPAGLGGINRTPSPSEFKEASSICYATVLRQMLNVTKRQLEFGGVLIVTKDAQQKSALEKLIQQDVQIRKHPLFIIGSGKQGGVNIPHCEPNSLYPIVVTDVAHNAGYNLQGLKSMVTSAFPTNPANLIQLDGRLDRIGQQGIPDADGQCFIHKCVVLSGLLHNLYRLKQKALNLDEALKSLAESCSS